MTYTQRCEAGVRDHGSGNSFPIRSSRDLEAGWQPISQFAGLSGILVFWYSGIIGYCSRGFSYGYHPLLEFKDTEQ